jgi:imidazolonepropionase
MAEHVIDADGRVVMPAFVDCHTHACFAGDRLDEWEMKKRGATYLQLLEAGGGIMSTVRAVREASEADLADALYERLLHMRREGTASVEVKSGYGLDTETELKMLGAIHTARARLTGGQTRIFATACIGHALDPDVADDVFVARTIGETLDAVHDAFPGVTIDAYCEKGAWTLDDCTRLFERAGEMGHPCRVHADQFNAMGMTGAGVRLGLRSVDHLEASGEEDLRVLAASETFGVMLPCSGFHLSEAGKAPGTMGPDYADGRGFVDAGGALAIATNLNPGSSPCGSMPMAIALAVRVLGLTAAEAISAATVNPATLLGLDEHGTIEPGSIADLIVLRHRDERLLGYEFGGDPVDHVIIGGELIR